MAQRGLGSRFWPLMIGVPLLAGLAALRFVGADSKIAPKRLDPPSRAIEGVTVKRPDPRVVTMPETPKDVADSVSRTRIRDLANQAVAAAVRGDKTTRGALVTALKKEADAKSEIDAMLVNSGGTEAAHLAALAREVAP